jgi:lipopolysaccharide export LptBFGC system permease protein LptF
MPKKKPKKSAKGRKNPVKRQSPKNKEFRHKFRLVEQSIKQKSVVEQKLHTFVSWTAMALLVFTNFLAAILLVPFLLFFEGTGQYVIVALFGIGFGLIFNLMIHSIEHLGDRHHVIAGVVVPCFALIDIVILFGLVEKAKEALSIDTTYNYTFIVILFIVAFLVPYIIDIIRQKHKFT